MRNTRLGWLRRSPLVSAFTLVEVLVVLFILLLLASIALPNVREIVADQMVARTARGITGYMDAARNRAIAEGRQVGVLIERFGVDARGRAHSIRLRQLTSVPPYTGDASNAIANLIATGTVAATLPPVGIAPPGFPTTPVGIPTTPPVAPAPQITVATFDPADNQLLALSASMVADPSVTGDVDDQSAPIRNGDLIELPGGRIVPFWFTFRNLNEPPTIAPSNTVNPAYLVRLNFFLNEPGSGAGSQQFPISNQVVSSRPVRFKIHRKPVVSTTLPFTMPRGVALDLNYSGIGVSGNQFAPLYDFTMTPPDPLPAYNIAIVFGPDGKVVSITNPFSGVLVPPIGQLFFCLGDSDGIRTDNLFSPDPKATSSILNLKSTWIVVNPSTGRVVSSPFAAVATIPAGTIVDPADPSLAPAIAEARLLANLSDTVDQE